MSNDSIRIAAQASISSLYHYQGFQPEKRDIGRLTDILENHRIFCSNPTDFNDPWDCKPYFDQDMVDDSTIRAAVAEYFIANQQGGPKGDRADHLLRTDSAMLKRLVQMFSEQMVEFISQRWGVYCLTPDPCGTLMWSHYSRGHRGICLEFGTDNPKFRVAQKVRYHKEYPAFSLHDQEALALEMLSEKSDVWEYEQEFRLICPRFTDVKAHPLIMDGNYLRIGANDLKSIIVGCQADYETVTAIKRAVAEYAPHVAVRQAKRAPNKYRLVIAD